MDLGTGGHTNEEESERKAEGGRRKAFCTVADHILQEIAW